MVAMRAKMKLSNIDRTYSGQEVLSFHPVAAAKYGEDGSDENNTYARFSPAGSLSLTVANPALLGKFHKGEEYYLDFTLATGVAAEPPTEPVEGNQESPPTE